MCITLKGTRRVCKGVIILEMIDRIPIILPEPGRPSKHGSGPFRACLSLDLGLVAMIANVTKEHIESQNQIDAEFIGTAVTHHINKPIYSFAFLCTAHFAIQPGLTEFRAHGLVINTGVRFIALIFSYNVHLMPSPSLFRG